MSAGSWFRSLRKALFLEVSTVFSSPREVLSCLVMPVVWCVLLAGLFNQGLYRGIPFGIVNEDQTPLSSEVVRQVRALPSLKLIELPQEQAVEQLRSGELKGMLLIPRGWSETWRRPGGKSLQLYVSRTLFAVSTMLELDVKKALSTWSVEKTRLQIMPMGGTEGTARITGLFQLNEVLLGNQAFNFRSYLLSGLIPMLIGLSCVLAVSNSLVREWRRNREAVLLRAAGSPLAAVLGKLLFWFGVYTVYMFTYIAWFSAVQGALPAGSMAVWLLFGFAFVAGMVSLAVLFCSAAPTWFSAMVMCVITTAPTIPFTGFTFPDFNMDIGARTLSHLLPLTWYIHGQEQQWVLGSPASTWLPTLGIALLFAVVPQALCLPLLLRRIRRRAESPAKQPSQPREEPCGSSWDVFRITLKRIIFNANSFPVLVTGIAFYLIFYGWPYSAQQITEVPTVIVDLDGSAASRDLIRDISGTSKVKPVALVSDERDAVEMLRADKVNAAILIPRDFESDLGGGRRTSVTVFGNGAFPAQAHTVYGMMLSLVNARASAASAHYLLTHGAPADSLARSRLAPPLLVQGDMFNTIGGYRNYLVPMVGVLIIQSVLLIGISVSVGDFISRRRREPFVRAAMEKLWGFFGMWAAVFAVALFWVLYAEGFYFGIAEFPTMGDVPGTLVLGVIYAALLAFFALAFTFSFGSNHNTTAFAVITSAPSVFLAGCIYPSENFSWWARAFAQIIPAVPGINGMLAVSQNGASLASARPIVMQLLLLCLFWGTVAYSAAMLRGSRLRRGYPPPDD
ncbi:MAG: ABC transporter permease [Mesosutterella sp.]|nr:ABC transporter permease [Mesosutterella sp.]